MTDRFDPDGPAPSPDGPRDKALPMLSVAQADALAAIAADAFRAQGVDAIAADGVLRGGGRVFGLYNLAASVAQEPWPEWFTRVGRHAAAMSAATQGESTDDDNPSADSMYLKLTAPDPELVPDYDASSLLPGVLAVAAEDHPTHVASMLSSDRFRSVGTWEQVKELGLANLRRLPPPEVITNWADEGRDDSAVYQLLSGDFFGASRVLVLDQLLAEVLRVEPTEHGCLVAVPSRELLVVHVLSGRGVVPAIEMMVNLAQAAYDAWSGPISNQLFHLPGDGTGQAVTHTNPGDNQVEVRVMGRFQDTFNALVG